MRREMGTIYKYIYVKVIQRKPNALEKHTV